MVNPLGAAGAAKAMILPAFAAGRTLGDIRKAESVIMSGASGEDVWNWYKMYPDPLTGQLKAVIPDTNAGFVPGSIMREAGHDSAVAAEYNPKQIVKLSQSLFDAKPLEDILAHKDLYDALPELVNTPVRKSFMSDALGSFDPRDGTIRLNTAPAEQNLLSTLLHETQHAVQNNFSMLPGGNSGMFIKDTKAVESMTSKARKLERLLSDEFDRVHANSAGFENSFYPSARIADNLRMAKADEYPHSQKDAQEWLKTVDPKAIEDYKQVQQVEEARKSLSTLSDDAYESYRRLAGEAEARLVQTQHKTGDYTTYPLKLMADELGVGVDDLPKVLIDPTQPIQKLDESPKIKAFMDMIEQLSVSMAAAQSKKP
jgi:hypothetical protein